MCSSSRLSGMKYAVRVRLWYCYSSLWESLHIHTRTFRVRYNILSGSLDRTHHLQHVFHVYILACRWLSHAWFMKLFYSNINLYQIHLFSLFSSPFRIIFSYSFPFGSHRTSKLICNSKFNIKIKINKSSYPNYYIHVLIFKIIKRWTHIQKNLRDSALEFSLEIEFYSRVLLIAKMEVSNKKSSIYQEFKHPNSILPMENKKNMVTHPDSLWGKNSSVYLP